MSTVANALNISATGAVQFNGTTFTGGAVSVANGGSGGATFTGVLTGNGASAFTASAVTQHDVLVGAASNLITSISPSTAGFVLTSNGAGADPSFQASSATGFTWTDVTGGSATLAAANGYIADSASLTTFTMPTNNSVGDTIKIVGKGTGLWKIVYGTGQNIIFGSATTATTTGHLDSTNKADSIELVCTTASATVPIFTVVSSIGNISVT